MGEYCLELGTLAKAQVGEELSLKKFTHTTAVTNSRGEPICIPHEGCTLQLVSVPASLASHPVLGSLRGGQTVQYRIENRHQPKERDIVQLKTGAEIDLRELKGCTFQITEEKPA